MKIDRQSKTRQRPHPIYTWVAYLFALLPYLSATQISSIAFANDASAEPIKPAKSAKPTQKDPPKAAVSGNSKAKPQTLIYIAPSALLRKQTIYTGTVAPNDENMFFAACHNLIAHKDITRASEFAHTAIFAHPTWSAPHVVLGAISELSFEDDHAIEHYKRGIAVAPNCLQAYSDLANLLRHCTDYKGSLATIKTALALIGNERSGEIDYIACELYKTQCADYKALKQYKKAIKSLEDIDSFTSFNNPSKSNLTEVLLDDKQYVRAIELSSKMLQLSPQTLEFYFLRAKAYAAINEDQKAIADLNKFIARHYSAISAASQDRLARALRASLYEKTGNTKLAKIDRAFLEKEQLDAYKDTTFVNKDK